MRYAKLELGGRSYVCALTTRVLMELEEEGTSLDKMMGDGSNIKGVFKLLEKMLRAGAKYAAMEGIETAGAPSYDELLDMTTPEDYNGMVEAVTRAINGERAVEAEVDPKNA